MPKKKVTRKSVKLARAQEANQSSRNFRKNQHKADVHNAGSRSKPSESYAMSLSADTHQLKKIRKAKASLRKAMKGAQKK